MSYYYLFHFIFGEKIYINDKTNQINSILFKDTDFYGETKNLIKYGYKQFSRQKQIPKNPYPHHFDIIFTLLVSYINI